MSSIDVHVFREAVAKVVRALTATNLQVRQVGTRAYVSYDRDGKPLSVTLPSIPDNAPSDLLNAIQGFMDHECSHLLHTDFNVASKQMKIQAKNKDKAMPALWNIVEDVFVERKMAAKFTGSMVNIDNIQRYLTGKILKEGFEKVQAEGASSATQRSYLMPSAVRAAAGQPAFVKFMEDKWVVMGELEKGIKALGPKFAKANSTQECWDLAHELKSVIIPPKPPAPPKPKPSTPPEKQDPQDDKEDQDDDEQEGDGEESGEACDNADSKDNDNKDDDAGDEEGEQQNSDDKDDADNKGESDEDQGGATEGDGEDEPDPDEEVPDAEEGSDPTGDSAPDDEGEEPEAEGEVDKPKPESTDDGDRPNDEPEKDKTDGEEPGDKGDTNEGPDAEEEESETEEESSCGTSAGSDGDDESEEGEEGQGQGAGDDEGADDADDNGDMSGFGDGDDPEDSALPTEPPEADDSDEKPPENRDSGSGVPEHLEEEPSIEDLIDPDMIKPLEDIAAEMIEDAIKQHMSMNPGDYVPYTRDWDYCGPFPAAEAFQSWSLDKSDVAKRAHESSHVIQGEVERIFRARSATRWNPGQRKGKLSRSSLHKACVGDDRVFRQKIEVTNRMIAVSLVLDMSGSMSGTKVASAAVAAYMLANVLEKIGVPCEIVGFTTMVAPINGHMTMKDWQQHEQSSYAARTQAAYRTGPEYARYVPNCVYVFKAFDKRFDDVPQKTLAFLNTGTGYMGGNIDGESIEVAAMRLQQRKEARKIMIVMSDGNPAADGNESMQERKLKQVVQDIAKSGMEIYGLGLMDQSVRDYYPHCEVVGSVDEIPGKVLALIQKLLVA